MYWVVTIPVTLLIVGIWYVWERRREAVYDREDRDIETATEDMEKNIMAEMRKRTVSKVSTWDTRRERKEKLANDEDNDYGAFKEPKKVLGRLLSVPKGSD